MQSASNVTVLHPDRDSDSLPEPFLPPDVDLAGFHYLPVMPDHLTSSAEWTRARRDPLSFVRFMQLLVGAFRQKPTGSLPNDDEALADTLGVEDEKWLEIKESAMRGWTLCSDNRWHHPLAAMFVREGWKKHRGNTKRTVKANEANALAKAIRDAERNAGRDAPRDADVTAHQGDEGEESKETIDSNESTKESLAPADAAPKRGRGNRIPPDWQPDIAYARSKGLHGRDLNNEVEKFRNYWTAKTGSGAMKADWNATWQNWVMTALERSAPRPSTATHRPDGSRRNPYDL